MCPRLSTYNADWFTVGVAIQLQFFMMSVAFSIHLDGLRWCSRLDCFQTVEFTQFVNQILHQVILGKAHFTKYLEYRKKTKYSKLFNPDVTDQNKEWQQEHYYVCLTRIQTIATVYPLPFPELTLPMHQLPDCVNTSALSLLATTLTLIS